MNDDLAHRGPDDEGTWADDNAGIFLGHRRLSIIDISEKGHQPMVSTRGNVIVFNGEVYNFDSLKQESNLVYQSDSDTEVILRHYEKHGVRALDDFNGMFAFVVWDAQKKQLFLARDRIGIKPLYYTIQNGIFAFSSEIRSLLLLPWIKKDLDHEALYHFLTFGKVMPPATMFKGIQKMHPGHHMMVDHTGIREYKPFWEAQYRDLSQLSEAEASEQTLHLLRSSVKQRMVSDVPVGAFLSGGVDSSAVVALMREHQATSNIKTFSIGFEDQPNYSELKFARKVAKQFNTEHYERVVSPGEMQEFIPRIAKVFDEPLSDPTSIPIYFISQLAKSEGIKVVLTGDGADELFCGYRSWLRYTKYYPWYKRFLKLPGPLRSATSALWSSYTEAGVTQEMLHRAAQGQEFFWGGANAFKESVKSDLLTQSYLNNCERMDSYSQIEYYKNLFASIPKNGRKSEDVDWMCFLGIKSIVPNLFLHRADRLGMAHSVELRVPFLEHNLVNWGLSLLSDLKIKNNEPKYILKKSLEDLLPKDILYRKKMGFCVPIREWGGEIMLSFMAQNLSNFCKQTGLFNEVYLQNRVAAYRNGQSHDAHALWNFYFLMKWFEQWIL